MQSSKRNSSIDIIKGVGISLVVLGHGGLPFQYDSYNTLFLISLFIFSSGYCYSMKHSETPKDIWKLTVKRLKTLYLVYIAWRIGYLLLNNLFVYLNIYSNNPLFVQAGVGEDIRLTNYLTLQDIPGRLVRILLFGGSEQMAMASWFLRLLFLVAIGYAITSYVFKQLAVHVFCKKSLGFAGIETGIETGIEGRKEAESADTTFKNKKIYDCVMAQQFILCIFTTGIGWYLSAKQIQLPNNLSSCFSVYVIYHLGVVMKNGWLKLDRDWFETLFSKTWVCVTAIIICPIILIVFRQFGYIAIDINLITNPAYLLICTLAGWCLVYALSKVMCAWIKNVFCYLGQHTISILFLHLLSFKIITYLQVIIYHKEMYYLAAFPVLYNEHGWFLAYLVVGLTVPILISLIVHQIWGIIRNSMSKRAVKSE